MRKYLAAVYNMLLLALCWMFVMAFYYHGAFYTFPPDMSKAQQPEGLAVVFLTVVMFILLKLWHLIEEKAEMWDIYEYDESLNEPPPEQ